MPSATQMQMSVMRNGRNRMESSTGSSRRVASFTSIAIILAGALVSLALFPLVFAVEPPPDLLKKIAQKETLSAEARNHYTYREMVAVQEFNEKNVLSGEYRETRDILFAPDGARLEQTAGSPSSTLRRLKLTDEDFADIRNVQPFLLTKAQLPLYESKFRGEEVIDGTPCFVVLVRPRQILSGQRFFEGMLWVRQSDFAIVRSEGQAVPQIITTQKENLFPHFTTIRQEVDGKWLFPVETYADDTLYFRSGPQRMRVRIRYSNYKRFSSDSKIIFDGSSH